MDALTALLRHIKLEPLIGANATPTQTALKPLIDAAVPPTGASGAAEGEPDPTHPNPVNAETARNVAAQNANVGQTRLAIVAEKAFAQQAGTGGAYTTRISPDATLLGQLVNTAQNSHAPMPTPLPLNVALQLPAQVAQTLNSSLTQSGVFYESHLQQWVAGERPLETLHQEPHNRLVVAAAPGSIAAKAVDTEVADTAMRTATADTSPADAPLRALPEVLQPVVREQLNALDFQRVLWQGEVWPQQKADLEIAREHQPREQDGEPEQLWHSTLRIELPGLGTVVAQVLLDDQQGARINLRATAEAIDALRPGGEAFRQSMEAAGIALRQLELSAEKEEGHG